MNIDSIQNGIVIDHISAGKGMTLYKLLKLDEPDVTVAIMRNVVSQKMGRKDIIKIDAADLEIDYDLVGFVDPDATINVIKNGELIEKKVPEMPELLKDVIKCKNPRCITSTEQELRHIFRLTDREKNIYRCLYCETKAEIK